MPRIVVTTEPRGSRSKAAVLLDERIVTDDLASGHFAAQLIERIGWALLDADGTEQKPPGGWAGEGDWTGRRSEESRLRSSSSA